jgi:PhzF family phenazine biosynthesis protein
MKSYIVDSFTDEPFKGNPAGVCFVEYDLSEELMLKIAREFGLSETAFVREILTPANYSIRFFSPKKEIPLCGHATLAAAKIIFTNTKHVQIHFINVENVDLPVLKSGNEIVIEFPIYNTVNSIVPSTMQKALGLDEYVNVAYSPTNKIILIEIYDSEILRQLNPDFEALLKSHNDINGVLVTAKSNNDGFDFHYRYFWPWAGTNEDPVTGGVQTFLAKYWSLRTGKIKMKAFQSSARTGSMTVELKGEKVLIYGKAQIVFEGNFLADK